MKSYEVTDFNGGMVDEADAIQKRYSRRLRNLLLDANGKPYQRNGLANWSVQTPTGERVSTLKVVRDMSNLQSPGWAAFAFSHHKLWYNTTISEAAMTGSWTEVLSPSDSIAIQSAQSIAPLCAVGAKAKLQLDNQFLYASFQDRIGTAGHALPIPRRIWWDSADGKFYHSSVGCPDYVLGASVTFGAGAGAHSYIYAFCYVIRITTANGTIYEYRGAPAIRIVSNITAPSAAVNAIGSMIRPYGILVTEDPLPWNGASSAFIGLEIYRTSDGGTVPRLLTTLGANAAAVLTYNDTAADSALGRNLYTADGTAAYNQAPPCKIFHAVNGIGYYGGFDAASIPLAGFMGALQSAPGVQESAPSANLIPTPDHLTGIESVDIYPIFFTRKSCWRVEGTIDGFGAGTVNLRPISERIGAARQSCIAKTDQGLVFASDDGVYYTDGFSATKMTGHLNRYYRSWFNSFAEAQIDDVSAVYHPPTKRYFFGSYQADAPTYNSMPNTLHAGDMRHKTDEGGAAHSYHQGETNQTTNGISFLPTALEVFGDTLLVGDAQGFVSAMKVEPTDSQGGDIVPADASIDGSFAPGSWGGKTPVVWDYISAILDFGNRTTKKWGTNFQITFKIRQWGIQKVYAQINSINDGAFWSDSLQDAQALKVVRDKIGPNKREWTIRRKFKKLFLRFTTKQIQVKKAYALQWSSNPNGVRAYHTVTVNATTKVAVLGGGDIFPDVIGQDMNLALDGYVRAYKITAVTGGTATLSDAGNHLVNGTYEWQISGYDKFQAHGIESFVIGYADLAPGTQQMVTPSTSGANP